MIGPHGSVLLSEQRILTERLTSLADLERAGLIARDEADALAPVAARYAVAVTSDMHRLIDPSAGPCDPIARQFVPTAAEAETHPGERTDPIGDAAWSPSPGLVHRYPDRVLLKAAATCPVYCRFCFRRAMIGPDVGEPMRRADLEMAYEYIRARPEIWEVIVTGGDPLVLSARRIAEIVEAIDAIAHVAVIRWHTRVPVVEPASLDVEMVAALKARRAASYVAIHANHPRELTEPARAAIARLVDAGIVCRSQTVLLRGVNDDPRTLAALMRGFVSARVVPYYLHQLDPAPGTAHFRVPLREAQALVESLRGHISGLCQPEFVVDIPGGAGKVRASRSALEVDGDGGLMLVDRNGVRHRYEDFGGRSLERAGDDHPLGRTAADDV